MPKTDWITIKNEYINSNISQRKLSEKHRISFNTLKARANKERWADLKKEQHDKTATKLQQKTAEIIVAKEVNRIEKLLKTSDLMQQKIDVCLNQLNMYVDMFGKTHQTEVLDVGRLKKLVSALVDLKNIVTQVDKSDDLNKLDEVLGKIEGNI